MYYLEMFGVSLLITLILESVVLLLLKEASWKNEGLLILVNVLTNPAAVLIAWICGAFLGNKHGFILQVPIEIVVVLVEAYVYCIFSKLPEWKIKKPVRLAIVANGVSWGLGVLIQLIK